MSPKDEIADVKIDFKGMRCCSDGLFWQDTERVLELCKVQHIKQSGSNGWIEHPP